MYVCESSLVCSSRHHLASTLQPQSVVAQVPAALLQSESWNSLPARCLVSPGHDRIIEVCQEVLRLESSVHGSIVHRHWQSAQTRRANTWGHTADLKEIKLKWKVHTQREANRVPRSFNLHFVALANACIQNNQTLKHIYFIYYVKLATHSRWSMQLYW